jgi:hypothetical protein
MYLKIYMGVYDILSPRIADRTPNYLYNKKLY